MLQAGFAIAWSILPDFAAIRPFGSCMGIKAAFLQGAG
jgi:hypothetical protein